MGSLWMTRAWRRGVTRPVGRTARIAVPSAVIVAGALVASVVVAGEPASAATQSATAAQQALSRAGRGWALAMYANGRDIAHSRVTLYLTSPGGAAYALHAWAHGTQWQLEAWSPDRARAIFATTSTAGNTVVHQLTLANGAMATFMLPQYSRVIGYGLPAGRSVLVAQQSGIYTYSLTGTRLARLSGPGEATGLASGGAVESRNGREIVVSARHGLSVVSPAGALLRRLPVPHTRGGCLPMRWSSPGVVIAACLPLAPESGPRVFRVPVSGGAPVALTPVQKFTSGYFGDLDAWTVAGTTYVQAEQGCGAGYLARLGAGDSIVPVTIPGSPESTVVDSVRGHRMLLTETGCDNRNRLVELTLPGGTARMILPYGPGAGAFAVVPFNSDDSQP